MQRGLRGIVRALPAAAGILALLVVWPAGCSKETSPPVLVIEPEKVELAPGDAQGAFTIRNGGGGTLDWSLESAAAWLVPESEQGSTEGAEQISFTIDAGALSSGPPTGVLEISSNGGDGSFRVRMWQALTVSPESLFFGDSLTALPIVLHREESVTPVWSASGAPAWLALDRAWGTLGGETDTLMASVNRLGLEPGVYAAALRISAGAYGEDTVGVSMIVGSFGSLTGHVYHAHTKIPIAGAQVSAGGITADTDAQGAYTLAGVPVGAQRLQVEREDYAAHDEMVVIAPLGSVRDVELTSTLHQRAVGGTLRNSLERPIQYARAAVVNPDGSASEITAVTDAQGRYLLSGVPEGERTLRWTHTLYQRATAAVTVEGDLSGVDAALTASPLPPPFVQGGLGPILSRVGCGSVLAQWSMRREETATGYVLERADGAAGEFMEIADFPDPSIVSFRDRGLGRQSYAYRVSTRNIDGLTGSPTPASTVTLAQWSAVPSSDEGPTLRYDQTAVYCSRDSSLLLFAGTGCESQSCGWLYNDLRRLDIDTSTWHFILPPAGPISRYDHASVYDPARNRMVVFGGVGVEAQLNDTWAFDLTSLTWSRLAAGGAAPAPRGGHIAVCDTLRDRIVLYGGERRGTTSYSAYNDVWIFDLALEQWEQVRTGEPGEMGLQPEGRADACGVLVDEPGRRWLVVYGGYSSTAVSYQDTWALDLDSYTWTRLADGPGKRIDAAGVYDPVHHAMIILGGRIRELEISTQGDVWALILDAAPHWEPWSTEPGGPSPRFGHTAVYDPVGPGMVVTAGNNAMTGMISDSWSLCLGD